MRFGTPLLARLLGLLLLGSHPLWAQVIEVSGGTSTAYDETGGTLTVHGAGSETSIGAGMTLGHFGVGGQSARPLNGGTLTTGQQQLRVDLPTDVFDTMHVLAGTGFGFRNTQTLSSGVTLFSGFTSQEGGGALFRTTALSVPLGVAQYRYAVTEHCSGLSTGIVSKTSSFLQSVECTPSKDLSYAATVGLGANAPYVGASLRWQPGRLKLRAAYLVASQRFNRGGTDNLLPVPEPIGPNVATSYRLTRSFTVSGLHQQFFTAASAGYLGSTALINTSYQPTTAQTSKVDQAGLQYQHHGTGFSVSMLRSIFHQDASASGDAQGGSDVGFSVAADREVGRFRLSEDLLSSRSNDSALQSLLISTLAVKVNAHLRYSQTVNVSNNGTTFAEGGEFMTSFTSFRVDYQLFYLASRPEQPFQQAMVFDAQLHLFRKLFLQASSNIDPAGRTVYTLNLGTQYARNAGNHVVTPGGLSGYAVTGHVTDRTSGNPVEGATILVGVQRCYTDSDGNFSFRESRPNTHPLRVMMDEFLQGGHFVLVNAPATVTSTPVDAVGTSVEIVVARILSPGTDYAAALEAAAHTASEGTKTEGSRP